MTQQKFIMYQSNSGIFIIFHHGVFYIISSCQEIICHVSWCTLGESILIQMENIILRDSNIQMALLLFFNFCILLYLRVVTLPPGS